MKITAGGRWNFSFLCFQGSFAGRTWDLEKKRTPKAFRTHFNLPAEEHSHARQSLRKSLSNVLVEAPCPTFSIKAPFCCSDPAWDISTHLDPQQPHYYHRENGFVQQNRGQVSKSPHSLLSTRHQKRLNCKPASTSHFLQQISRENTTFH